MTEKETFATLHAGIDCDTFAIRSVTAYELTCRTCGGSTPVALPYLEAQQWADEHRKMRCAL